MQNKRQAGVSPLIILLAIAIIAVIGIVVYSQNKDKEVTSPTNNTTKTEDNMMQKDDSMMEDKGGQAMEGKMVSVVLGEQNRSKQSGSATITNVNGKTKVVVNVSGAPKDTPQPTHIHLSSCNTIGAVKYPLANVINGKSETTLDVSVEKILEELPLSLNVHKSAAEASVYVACGDIKAAEATEGDGMMKKDDSTMTDDNMKKVGEEMMGTGEQVLTAPAPKIFNLTGQSFAFSTSEIRVKKGGTVKINFESTGGFHDWYVDGYNKGTKQVNPGEKTSVEFVADKAGTFEFFCTVGNHRQQGMTGKLIVE